MGCAGGLREEGLGNWGRVRVEGRITDVFQSGYCLNMEIGGRKLSGFLFSGDARFGTAFRQRNEE